MLTRERDPRARRGRAAFQVVPAVDVLDGEAVRVEQGRLDRVVARRRDPEALVRTFVCAGAELVHLVDLRGARSGRARADLVRRLAAAAAPAALQASGGVRSPRDAERLLAAGAARVVVGTAAFAAPGALAAYRAALGDRLAVALDVRGGRVLTHGWTRTSALGVDEAAERCAEAGVACVLCTAVERDGTLAGPDLALLARVRVRFGGALLAAGGVASPADLEAVAGAGCDGAVVGRALLDGRLPLSILQRP